LSRTKRTNTLFHQTLFGERTDQQGGPLFFFFSFLFCCTCVSASKRRMKKWAKFARTKKISLTTFQKETPLSPKEGKQKDSLFKPEKCLVAYGSPTRLLLFWDILISRLYPSSHTPKLGLERQPVTLRLPGALRQNMSYTTTTPDVVIVFCTMVLAESHCAQVLSVSQPVRNCALCIRTDKSIPKSDQN
jgi:hypothetical protein